LASALSQQPCLLYEESGGKRFYRVTEPEQLLAFIGVSPKTKFAPVMSEQFHLYCDSTAQAEAIAAALSSLSMDGKPIISARFQGSEVFGGCHRFDDVAASSMVAFNGQSRRFYDLFYRVDGAKSGMHHPDGILWIRTPEKHHFVGAEKVPLRSVAPTILSLLDIPKTADMTGEAVAELAPARA
ncbi:MAG: hypothetical protein ABUS51_09115, partial [Acidobacteriota bacterium]